MTAGAASAAGHRLDPVAIGSAGSIYRDLGVEPIINCAGVRTNYGGSNPSRAVLDAMEAAATAFVDLDELMEAAGSKIAGLTGADWATVTSGSAAALALATAACISGNDPERMLSLPILADKRPIVIMPASHRFAYDHAIRMTGAEIATFSDSAELAEHLGHEPVMACVLGRKPIAGFGSFRQFAQSCSSACIPLVVDAAAQGPTSPDRWLKDGATMVIYSGGKYLQGPQSTALLIGQRRLVSAAWRHGAPHQAWGRPMKVGKEEIVGAVVALEQWLSSRSETSSQIAWQRTLDQIARHVLTVPGIVTEIIAATPETVVPRLLITWAPETIAISFNKLADLLLSGRPRILLHDFWANSNRLVIDPFNLTAEEADVVGERLAAIFADPPSAAQNCRSSPLPDIDLDGEWDICIEFDDRKRHHRIRLREDRGTLKGEHQSPDGNGEVSGRCSPNGEIAFEAVHRCLPMSRYYGFSGRITASGQMQGIVVLGAAADEHLGPIFKTQFGSAPWTARLASPRQGAAR